MSRITIALILATGLLVNYFATEKVNAIDVVWDGGDGLWDDANWNSGLFIEDFLGTRDGSNGWKGPEGEDEYIYIGGGATVTYPANDISSDFRIKQGGHLIIQEGATWQQVTDASWSENRWTEFDASSLIIDGGTFRRVGNVPSENNSGGAFILGSWRGDDNWDVAPIDHFEINIEIKNGGRLENEGELWVGSWDDNIPDWEGASNYEAGSVFTITINDGTVDLTGAQNYADESAPAAGYGDVGFYNVVPALEEYDQYQPTFVVNFTGPGTFIVDRAGIINAHKDENLEWQGTEPITYQELWDAGILQADGLSGPDGADFNSYFAVTGSLGADNYTLTRTAGILGDYDGSGVLDEPDLNMQAVQISNPPGDPTYDLNDDGVVDVEDRKIWVNDLKNTYVGDANLDLEFNSGDMVQVFSKGKYETQQEASWGEGDFNGDKKFDSGDMVAAFVGGGYELGPKGPAAVGVVPEPSGVVLAIVGLLGLAGLTRRRGN